MNPTALALAGLIGATAYAGPDKIDFDLENVFDSLNQPDEAVSVLVYLHDQGDIPQLSAELDQQRATRGERNEVVVQTLRDTASVTQQNLMQFLRVLQQEGKVASFEPLWLANVVRVDAPEHIVRQIAQHPDVHRVYFNYPIESIHKADGALAAGGGPGLGGGVEVGIKAINAPDVWAMGYDGTGVLVASLDTGVDGDHDALAHRWRGLHPAYVNNPQWAWFDPVTHTTFPEEFNWVSHGTHTMGTVLGGPPGLQIGVAPGAQWIHAAVIDRVDIPTTVADAIAAFQWMVAPTGNPAHEWAVPHVCSNSWGLVTLHGYPPCDPLFWYFIDNSEAAGTIQIFAAGNEGASGLRRPADRASDEYRSIAIAAVDANDPGWPLALFSSQGPTFCTFSGQSAIKPEISAPGVDVISAVDGNQYGPLSGTSMATPHINGVAALIVQACPGLTVEQVKQVMYDTAVDLGTPGKDNQFGYGMVDAFAAVELAESLCPFNIMLPAGPPTTVSPVSKTDFKVRIFGTDSPVIGSETLYYRYHTKSWQSSPLIHEGGERYLASLPPIPCGSTVQFYVQATSTFGSTRTAPLGAPFHTYTANPVSVTQQVMHESFSQGLPAGWNASGLWNVTNTCNAAGDCGSFRWAYYGQNDCTYDPGTAHSGTLTSKSIQLPQLAPNQTLTANFCYSLVQYSTDVAWFAIEQAGDFELDPTNGWVTWEIDISDLAGKNIDLNWTFRSSGLSPYEFPGGLWVDDVSIILKTHCTTSTNDDPVGKPKNGDDLVQLLMAWGACDGCEHDLTGDGVIDQQDLLLLLNQLTYEQ